jgi:tRNA(adenine34) deaminase
MQQALKEAQKAFDNGEVPIGAIIVLQGKIIARGNNQVELLNDCTAHAEMIALTSAFHFLGSKYLMEAAMFVTLEPCIMCAGALYWSKIGRVVYAAPDPKHGYHKTATDHSPFHPKTIVQHGICKEESLALMQTFFVARRK